MGTRSEKARRKTREKEGNKRGEMEWRAVGKNMAQAVRAAAGGACGRGLISISNGCEMRLAPLEAARV